jgi:hypothetical protein
VQKTLPKALEHHVLTWRQPPGNVTTPHIIIQYKTVQKYFIDPFRGALENDMEHTDNYKISYKLCMFI